MAPEPLHLPSADPAVQKPADALIHDPDAYFTHQRAKHGREAATYVKPLSYLNTSKASHIIVGMLALLAAGTALVTGVAYLAGFTKADGGHVVVIRNGGPSTTTASGKSSNLTRV